eukprot:scaffold224508_cov12-Tisochrysis_lutea.AAC.1
MNLSQLQVCSLACRALPAFEDCLASLSKTISLLDHRDRAEPNHEVICFAMPCSYAIVMPMPATLGSAYLQCAVSACISPLQQQRVLGT